MDKIKVSYPNNGDRLKTLLQLYKSGDRNHEVGTAFLPSGCRMPDQGQSAHPRHEVSIILDGRIRTHAGGKTVTLTAGDMVSIPENQAQYTEVMEDTRLVYLFFDA